MRHYHRFGYATFIELHIYKRPPFYALRRFFSTNRGLSLLASLSLILPFVVSQI